jgi:hypothetical protein
LYLISSGPTGRIIVEEEEEEVAAAAAAAGARTPGFSVGRK